MDSLTFVLIAFLCIFIGWIIGMFIISIMNIYYAITNYKKPELFCSNCGKKLSKKRAVCPKCKSVFVEENEEENS